MVTRVDTRICVFKKNANSSITGGDIVVSNITQDTTARGQLEAESREQRLRYLRS